MLGQFRCLLDLEKLKKGDVITYDEIIQIGGLGNAKDEEISAFIMWLLDEIEDRKQVTVVFKDGNLYILTDEQALVFNLEASYIYLIKTTQSYQRMVDVDVNNLSKESRKEHERNIATMGPKLKSLWIKRLMYNTTDNS